MITFGMFQTADMTLESMVKIKYTYSSICQLLTHISMEVIQILYNDCPWRADDNEFWDRQYDLGVKGQCKIYIKLSCQLILYFDGGYSYLKQYLF